MTSLDESKNNTGELLQTTISVEENLADEPYAKIIMELETVGLRARHALYMALKERNDMLPLVENQLPFSWALSVKRLLSALVAMGYTVVEDCPLDEGTWLIKAEREGDLQPIVVQGFCPMTALAQVVLLAHQETKPRISLPS